MPPTVDVNAYVTTQAITRRLDFLNADEYRQLAIGRPGAVDYGASTNWLDEVLQTPFSQVYNVSLRGGTRNTQYIANLNYRNLEGIIQRSDNRVFYPRFEVVHNMFDGKLKLNGTVSANQQNLFSGADGNSFNPGVYRNALNYNPTDQPKDADGNWVEHVDRTDYANPVALLRETTGKIQNTNLRTYGTISYFPIEDLQIMLLGSRDLNNSVRGYYESKKHYSTRREGRNGYASRGTTRQVEDMVELTAQYNKSFGEHQLTALAGYSWRETTYENYYMQNWDFPTDNYTYHNIGAGLALTRGQAAQASYQSQNKLLSTFFRLNYSFRDKYLLMASIRREGSSKFGVNNKWGNFPAVSAGWNIHREAFMGNLPLISSLKLRAGFGVTGTEPGSPYQSLNRLGFGTNTYYNGQWIQTVAPVNNANPDLKWETKEETNIGLDFGLLRNRISGSVDLYRRTTKDLLVDYPVPTPPYLFSTLLANAAVMENKGLEVQLNATPVETSGFQWTTSLNFSTNRNRIVSLSDENFSIASGYFDRGNTYEPIQQPISRVQIGQPIGNFFGYKSLDIDEDGHWIIEGKDGEPKPIANQQNDDKQILGNGMPKHYLNWNNTLVYKNFDLNVTMRGAFGFQILNVTRMYYGVPVGLNRGNVFANAFDNVYGKRPLADNQELQYVSYYVEDGDYWKIDNVTLGYNLGLKNKIFKNIRVYVSGNNLATFTGYSGIDPEISASYDEDFLVPGVDSRNRYPATASYTVGASITF
jgi:TonB-linked SusC/RagA family outer membrane protein